MGDLAKDIHGIGSANVTDDVTPTATTVWTAIRAGTGKISGVPEEDTPIVHKSQ